MCSSLEDSEIIVLTCNFLPFKFCTNLDISLLFFSADSSGITWYCQPTCSVSAVYNDCACGYSWVCRQAVMGQECTDPDFNHSDFVRGSILTEYPED